MAKKKEKKNKLITSPGEETEKELTIERPYNLWREMDKMFDDFRSNFDDLFWPFKRREAVTTYTRNRAPLMDVADLGNKYEMQVEMPGIPKDNIKIEVTPNDIEISAEHEETKEDKGKNWLRRERSSMNFYRSIELPEEIKSDKVKAEMNDGVLNVMLPKTEPKPKHTPKKVKIK